MQFIRVMVSFLVGSMLNAAGLRAGDIHEAAAAGNLNEVRAMVEANPKSIASKDSNGSTLLHSACQARQMAAAVYLMGQGADVNSRNNYGFTPFHFACNGRPA